MADGTLNTKSRDDWRNDYLRWARLRNPNAKTGFDEEIYVDACNLADQLVVLSGDARVIAGRISLQDRTGSQLDEVGRPTSEGGIGVPRPGAVGASGALTISTTAGGTDIVAGAILTTVAGVQYRVVNSGHQTDGSSFAIICVETGPQTNLAPGTKLTWSSPPPGCFANAVVLAQPDNTGLTGGREALGDDDYRELLADAQANPAVAANDAELQRLIEDSRGHGVAAEKAFTFNSMLGPGITGFTFTMRGSASLMSRLPSSDQFNIVAAYVAAKMPATDGLLKLPLVTDPMILVFRVKFETNGWLNQTQWPPYMATSARYSVQSSGIGLNSFTVRCNDGVYVSGGTPRAAPIIGQVIGLFDIASGIFKRKTISNVAGSGPWTLTCDTTTSKASDVDYLPRANQYVVPWSDSLNTLAALVVAHTNKMGPGEAVDPLPEDGIRMARSPKAKVTSWPSAMDGQLLSQINALLYVQRATHEDGASFVTSVGDATHVHLASLSDLGFYPL